MIYVHLFVARLEIFIAKGIPSESFYPPPTALRTLSQEARIDLLKLIPELDVEGALEEVGQTEVVYGKTARPFAKPEDIPTKLNMITCAA